MSDNTRTITDPREQRRVDDAEEIRATQFSEDVKNLLKKPYGRNVLQRIMRHSQIFEDIVPTDPLATAHFLGKRTIGLYVRYLVKQANPDALSLMEHEEALEPAAKRMRMP